MPPSPSWIHSSLPVVASSAMSELFLPEQVHHVVDDDRVEARRRIGIGPCDLELPDVRLLDLVEVDEIGAVGSGEVVPPVPVAARGAGEASQRGGSQTHRDERERPGRTGQWRDACQAWCCENIRQSGANFEHFEEVRIFEVAVGARGSGLGARSSQWPPEATSCLDFAAVASRHHRLRRAPSPESRAPSPETLRS